MKKSPTLLFLVLATFSTPNADANGITAENVPPRFRCESGHFLTEEAMNSIKGSLVDVIFEFTIANVVRLTLHDCVGGCDGCLNPNDPDNNPGGFMLETTGILDNIYDLNGYNKYLTRADFYILAAVYGLEQGIRNANEGCQGNECIKMPKIDFEYCRRDCQTSPITENFDNLPQASLDHSELMAFFRDEFGLTQRQTVAIMGAHTLGGASDGDSGYSGTFVGSKHEGFKFNNLYFKNLVNSTFTWNHFDRALINGFEVPRWQWDGFKADGSKGAFSLNVDTALVLDITTLPTGESTCTFDADNRCADAPTIDIVREYAEDVNLFVKDFLEAFQIMVRKGNEGRLVKVFKGQGN